MSPNDDRHGTYAGAQNHRKEGDPLCQPCHEAAAAYQREWRKTAPHDNARQAARTRALWRLAKAHHDEYEALFVEEIRVGRVPTAAGRPV